MKQRTLRHFHRPSPRLSGRNCLDIQFFAGDLLTGFFCSSIKALSSEMSCSNFLGSRPFSISSVSSVMRAYWLASNMFLKLGGCNAHTFIQLSSPPATE